MATWYGIRRGSLMVAASAMVPARASGSAKRACSAATIRSADKASSKPPPTAIPLTAAITGLFKLGSCCSPPNPPTP